jgi:hypothetical protein
MPMPAEHIKQTLDVSRSLARLSRLMQDADIDDVLNILHDDPAARKKAEQDPTTYLTAQGVSIPSGIKASFADNNWSVKFCTSTKSKICLSYSSAKGWDIEVN